MMVRIQQWPADLSSRMGRAALMLGTLVVLLALAGSPVVAQSTGEAVDFTAGGRVEAVALTADGQRFAVGARDNTLHLLTAEGQTLWEFAAQNSILGVDLSADGAWVAVAAEDRNLYLLDGEGQTRWQFKAPRPVNNAAVADDGSLVAATVDDLSVYALDNEGTLLWQNKIGIGTQAVAIYGKGEKARVIIGADDGWLTLYSRTGETLLRTALDYRIHDVAVSPNGAAIVAGTVDGTISLIDGRNGQVRWQHQATQAVNGVAIAADGQSVLAGMADGTVLLLNGEGAVTYQQNQPSAVLAVALSADGNQLALGSVDSHAQLIDREASLAGQSRLLTQRRWLLVGALGLVAVLVIASGWTVRNTAGGRQFWSTRMARPRTLLREIWQARLSYLLILPTVLLLLTFNYYPAASGLYHAFTDWNPVGRTEWVGLENFRFLASDRFFIASFRNVVILVIAAMLKTLTLPLLAAELIFHLRNRRVQYWARTLFIVPIVLPMVVEILVWNNIYDPTIGLLNETLRLLGLDTWTRVWYGEASSALASVIFIGFPWVEAFSLLIFYGGLISISEEIFDAGKVDGANSWQRFWYLEMPLLFGQVKLLLILNFINAVQTFELVFLTTGGGPGAETYTPALELYYMAMRMDNLGVASAIGMVLFLIILIGTLINMRFVRSSTEGDA